ncbi:unnamed protein product, partial [Prorocentrum cordatum]
MEALPALRAIEDGVISENLLRALTLDDLRSLSPCDGRLARLLTGSRCWFRAASAEAPFLRLEASWFSGPERAGLLRALRALRRSVPARGLCAPLGSAGQVKELAGAVTAAVLAAAHDAARPGSFAAPVVGLLRWPDGAALRGALSPREPKPEA